jgi:hypothetical protein
MAAHAGSRIHIVGQGEGATPAGRRIVLWGIPEGGADPVAFPLEGPFRWAVEGMRTCVGRLEGGSHVPCPRREVVTTDARCLSCSGLESPECVFEPRCQADPSQCTCVASFKGVEHVVYAAFYGLLPKVGMTQAWRVAHRLREQGADAWFTVQGGLDRPTARTTERAIAALYRIPEHRSHRETLPQLARPVPWDLVVRRADELRERLGARYPVERATHRILDHPVEQPLPGVPRRVACHGLHAGTWMGGKGNNLFYREAPHPNRLAVGGMPIASLRCRDLLGRHVTLS